MELSQIFGLQTATEEVERQLIFARSPLAANNQIQTWKRKSAKIQTE